MSNSNIIIRARYKHSLTTSKNISKWFDYVSKKEKADSTSLDEKNMLKEYYSLASKDSFLFEKCESFVWSSDGDANPKQEIKNMEIDNTGFVWNFVISFPPDFALNNGLITKSDYYELSKNIMPSLITDMGLKLDNAKWYACLHRNTDNPHLHIIVFEKNKTINKGFVPNSTIYNLKSNIASYLINNTEFYKLRDKTFSSITGAINLNDLNKVKNQKLFSEKYRKELNNRLLNLYKNLPSVGRLQYNSKRLDEYRSELKEIINFILLHDSTKYNYANYLKLLEQHQKELNELYGLTKENKARKYYNDQLNRLYSKIGNEILQNFKIYQSLDLINREKLFLSKHIVDMEFKSRNDYKNEKVKYDIATDLYKLCLMSDLNDTQIKKVFTNWIKNSKYDINVDSFLNSIPITEYNLTSTEFYKALNRLGFNYEKYQKFKTKYFYMELNYKKFINRAFNYLEYELKEEEKQIINKLQYDLEEYNK